MTAAGMVRTADVGSRGPWIRDLCLVGGATSIGAPLAASVLTGFIHFPEASLFLAAAGLFGLASGAALGAVTPALVSWRLGRMPRIAFLASGLAVGAAWGAFVGAAAGLVLAPHERLWVLSALIAAPVGSVQLGWFWLAATQRRVRRRPVGGILASAALLAPVLGWGVMRLLGLG